MEDYLITLHVSFVDTDTGEVLANSHFSKPLSVFGSDVSNYCRYFDSFFRGVRQGKSVAMSLLISLDRDLPDVKQLRCF